MKQRHLFFWTLTSIIWIFSYVYGGTITREEKLVTYIPAVADVDYYEFRVEGVGTDDKTQEGRLFGKRLTGIDPDNNEPSTVWNIDPSGDGTRITTLNVDTLYAPFIYFSHYTSPVRMDPNGCTSVQDLRITGKLVQGELPPNVGGKYVWPIPNSPLDVAEMFATSFSCKPADVVSFGKNGVLFPCRRAYDTKFVGVVSLRPAITLASRDHEQPNGDYRPIALRGQVLCNVTDEGGTIEAGDLLTSSNVAGCAMKANPTILKNKTGTLVGKALQRFDKKGRGKIRILLFKG